MVRAAPDWGFDPLSFEKKTPLGVPPQLTTQGYPLRLNQSPSTGVKTGYHLRVAFILCTPSSRCETSMILSTRDRRARNAIERNKRKRDGEREETGERDRERETETKRGRERGRQRQDRLECINLCVRIHIRWMLGLGFIVRSVWSNICALYCTDGHLVVSSCFFFVKIESNCEMSCFDLGYWDLSVVVGVSMFCCISYYRIDINKLKVDIQASSDKLSPLVRLEARHLGLGEFLRRPFS
ncbi:hypothetical protein AAMO2058_000443700 [Amorphochlora amoebiformis]